MRTGNKNIQKRKLIAGICAAFYLTVVSPDVLSSPVNPHTGDQLHTKIVIRLLPASPGHQDENDIPRIGMASFCNDFTAFLPVLISPPVVFSGTVPALRQAWRSTIYIHGEGCQ